MSYLMSKLMHKKDYPTEHKITEEMYKKLVKKQQFREVTFEEYRAFLNGPKKNSELQHDYEMFEEDFQTKGQYLNWLLERRLKDGHIL